MRWVIFLFCFLFSYLANAQLNKYSFAEAEKLMKETHKATVVFIYTDWCKYCETMKNTTLKDEKLMQLLNQEFNYVSLNAEQEKDILFSGHTFKYKKNGNTTGHHELAEQLGAIDGKLTYPVLCVISSDYEIVFQYQGFLSAEELQTVLSNSN